ncbi:hypothetical protein AU156_gp231 [Edwardsiella phage PEi20]|uniref:Uncharacterized protein n=1 Tax=Edwardsiella phage PEi20 TaxID=1608310 RepID=A0A0B6VSU2_9CAUD|nr:hypothetical protein AU156_gp231 [Edwardsiella phage PEi20]BAQ22870.1 hypothetical protein [Edwardsiella phage PEi20]
MSKTIMARAEDLGYIAIMANVHAQRLQSVDLTITEFGTSAAWVTWEQQDDVQGRQFEAILDDCDIRSIGDDDFAGALQYADD